MKELYRITKKGGFGLIQTPFKLGKIYEDDSIKTEVERLKHFGQKDHVRIYSVKALKERLESVGFIVELLKFIEVKSNKRGFKREEKVLFVRKRLKDIRG